MVRPEEAFPNAHFSNGGPLALNIFVERFGGDTVRIAEKPKDWMVSRLIGNFHAETAKHSQELVTAMGATGIVPIEQYFNDKSEVLGSGVGDVPNYLLQVPQVYSPDQASDAIVEQLELVIQRHGIGAHPGLSLVSNKSNASPAEQSEVAG